MGLISSQLNHNTLYFSDEKEVSDALKIEAVVIFLKVLFIIDNLPQITQRNTDYKYACTVLSIIIVIY